MVLVFYVSVVFPHFCLLLQSIWLIYLFINCNFENHISLLLRWHSLLWKLLEKCILLFYQKRFNFWFSRRCTMIHGMSPHPFRKLGGHWWILNCCNFFISLNLHFLKFDENFNENFTLFLEFPYLFLWFFFLCSCPQSWAWN